MKTQQDGLEKEKDFFGVGECEPEDHTCAFQYHDSKVLNSQAVHRRCLVSRRIVPKEHLIRFVAAPDGTVVPDLRCRLPGRGVWVTAQRSVVDQAVSRGLFAHALRSGVKVNPTLGQEVDACFEKAVLQALAFTNKAGACRVGYNHVREALKAGRVAGLFAAIEASEDRWNALKQLAFVLSNRGRKSDKDYSVEANEIQEFHSGGDAKLHIFQGFSTDLLSRVFGKSGVFFGALLDHVGNKGYLVCVNRLMWYRTSSGS